MVLLASAALTSASAKLHLTKCARARAKRIWCVEKVVTLAEAVRRLTGLPASNVGLIGGDS